nr:MAG TPA: ABC-type polysaccharide/polyol phosphate transport system, ATPase component [Caudoviricetes sp.]
MFNSEKDVAIEVKEVSKSFKLPLEKSTSLKQALFNALQGKKGFEEHQVLRDISFKIYKGDFIGIVGRNGSGKSTLLKLMAQIYYPDSGEITVDGVLVPFIELGVGFSPELTGHDNVYLNGALMGFSTKEIDAMYDDIVDFAELGQFMEQKIKNYSSGMLVRLAFSMAIRAQSDILLLDEILAVGDEAFQRKCYAYFAKLRREKKTVVLVTHSMDSVQRFCNRAILIHDGDLKIDGSPLEVAQAYQELNNQRLDLASLESQFDTGETSEEKAQKDEELHQREENVDVTISHRITSEKIDFDLEIIPKRKLDDAVLTFVINSEVGEIIFRVATDDKNVNEVIDFIPGVVSHVHLSIDNIFPNGIFSVQVAVKKKDRSENYLMINNALLFEIHAPVDVSQNWKPPFTFAISPVKE